MNLQNTSEVIEVPVLIVGGGPSGLTASLLLSRYGIDNLLINKYRWTANGPRAHITNQRTMEVFRDAGVEPQVVAAASPHELMANNVWATSFSGQELGRLLTWGNAIERKSDYELASPSAMCNIPSIWWNRFWPMKRCAPVAKCASTTNYWTSPRTLTA